MSLRGPPSAAKLVKQVRDARRITGAAFVAIGLLLMAGVGAYYAYAALARGELDDLNYTKEAVSPPSPQPRSNGLAPQGAPAASPASVASLQSTAVPYPGRESVARASVLPSSAAQEAPPSLPIPSYDAVYPGLQMHPKYWDQPLWAGADPYIYLDDSLPDGFQRLMSQRVVPPAGAAAQANRIRIPLLDVDSPVSELQIVNLGDSRSYQTPDNVVGHIPVTANPSEVGNGWYFGHLESPIRGEGNVFHRLPEIPDLLRSGDPVYVVVDSADGGFLYEITATRVVHEDDLALYDVERAQITLVTCVPRLVYDHRLTVTAELVGVRE